MSRSPNCDCRLGSKGLGKHVTVYPNALAVLQSVDLAALNGLLHDPKRIAKMAEENFEFYKNKNGIGEAVDAEGGEELGGCMDCLGCMGMSNWPLSPFS